MFSYAVSTATTYFHLPFDEEEDRDIEGYQRKYLTWNSELSESQKSSNLAFEEAGTTSKVQGEEERNKILDVILGNDDLYIVLGVDKTKAIDKLALRRAYLKIAVAYDVLSTPSSKRLYDRRSPYTKYDVFSTRPTGHAEETFRSVVIGIFNDFLDGDLEVIKTLLKAISEYNPSLTLGDDGINSVLTILQTIRERALTCRTCINTLHGELGKLLEVQQEMRQLSYFNVFGRSRLTIQLTRITLSLPFVLEKALEEQHTIYGNGFSQSNEKSITILPKHLNILIRNIDFLLATMERIL